MAEQKAESVQEYEREVLRGALARLHDWALAQEGDCLFSGDHPIAQAAAALAECCANPRPTGVMGSDVPLEQRPDYCAGFVAGQRYAESHLGVRVPVANRLRELIDRYWSLAYAEGKEGREHDTEDGAAQQCRHEIEEVLRAIDGVKERFQMHSDKELLDWMEKNFDSAEGQQRCKQSITGWITRYLYWGKRAGGDGNLREAIRGNMRAYGVKASRHETGKET